MIAKGTPHANGAHLARYMVTGKDGETAELHDLRGFAEADIVAAFRSEHVIARGTRCKQPFFHCQVRNPAGEHLTREQWARVASRIESKLKLTDQPRAIAFHMKDGHEHMHIAWSRIDHETLKAKALPFYKLRLKEVCRQLEVELGITMVRNEREAHEPRAAGRAERDQATRLGVDIEAVRGSIRDAWTHSDNGRAFMAALAAEGMTLARGDKRDYVVVDGEGGFHALGKRLLGVSAAETRARLDPLDRDTLPTIAEAREQSGRRTPEDERGRPSVETAQDEEKKRRDGERPSTTSDNAGMVAQNAEANRRHLELNPFLRPDFDRPSAPPVKPIDRPTFQNDPRPAATTPEEKQRRIDEIAKKIDEHWKPPGHDMGRDR